MMNSLDAIIKSTNFAQKINSQIGISNSCESRVEKR